MATLRATMINFMTSNGLFDADAISIMADVEKAPENLPMQGRWDDEVNDYPPAIEKLALISVKNHVIAWMDSKHPNHWARPLFS